VTNLRRRGFTLIEILVVIGIILVLVGIVTVGIGYVTKAGKNNSVKVTLNNLRGMITELEATAGLAGRQPTDWAYSGNGNKANIAAMPSVNVWKDANPSTAGVNEALLVPEGPVTIEMSENDGPRYGKDADAVVNTQLIMQLLLGTPKNRTMLGQFPQGSLMEKVPGSFTPKLLVANNANDRTPTPAVPLDPWGNPIIFVPGAGLCGGTGPDDSMWVGGERNSTEAKQVVQTPNSTQLGPIQSPDARPFWASAGPDGDFRTGDDNVYSFEN
jgi:prepilin-type N-terminal cleavage/methylation domain-containing protein